MKKTSLRTSLPTPIRSESGQPAKIDGLSVLQRLGADRLDVNAVAAAVAGNEEDIVEDIAADADPIGIRATSQDRRACRSSASRRRSSGCKRRSRGRSRE